TTSARFPGFPVTIHSDTIGGLWGLERVDSPQSTTNPIVSTNFTPNPPLPIPQPPAHVGRPVNGHSAVPGGPGDFLIPLVLHQLGFQDDAGNLLIHHRS
ncbi:MAG: hypothetical protein OXC53_08670, partial [Rhodobacteraceae bacterium]|nr:hypothetical protein [Paracoccaceae bacterium]